MNYKDFNDFELLDYIYSNNEDANEILLYKYRPLIVNIAEKFIKKSDGSLDLNDLVQEGMLALNDAIISFNDEKEANFGTFAKVCIERRMSTFIRDNNRNKHKILNESVSYDLDDEEDLSIEKFLADNTREPLTLVTNDEWGKLLIDKINKNLTNYEQEVFALKLQGYNYKEIAGRLDKTPKNIDNALQRIKTKVKAILDELTK